MRKIPALLAFLLLAAFCISAQTEGSLYAVGKEGNQLGACPLKHTDVKVSISGFLARVKVTQEFENNFSQPIEAVYTFPLSQNSAVDDMTMRIGERTIRGRIMKREEARKVYETAKSQGKTASLLDQERPNIFTQSVANILPNEKIIIEISYVETLKFEDGQYEFVFPMTVGPRYIPGTPIGKQGGGFSPDTNRVPDASKITPMPALTRAGHDISIEVNLDAGVPVEGINSNSHEVQILNLSQNSAKISLRDLTAIPNKDFVLRYDVTGKRIEDAVLTHRGGRGGFFTMILQPPDNFQMRDVTPKEIVFVLDTSGSMSGFPIEKAKEAMKMALEGLNPYDTFNLITFAGDTHILYEQPVAATPESLARAQQFLESRSGGGGTEMMKAIRAALAPTESQKHIRIVCFMTDGLVGNEAEIIAEVEKHKNARVFSFGIGNSVNRYLLDKMAEAGRGEVEYVSLKDDGSAAARRFHERIRNPLLTDISIDWGNLPVSDVYPARIGDLFSAKPVVVSGRFSKAASGSIKLKGKVAGMDYFREIPVVFPENEPKHDVLATLWARRRVDELMLNHHRNRSKEIEDTITNLGIEFRLMTQFTSFVAVEERIVNQNGQPIKVEVPVEMPDGVSREGVFGVSSDPHGFIYQRGKSRRVAEMINQPANVTALSVAVDKKDKSSDNENNTRPSLPSIIQEDSSQMTDAARPDSSGLSVMGEILQRIETHQSRLTSLRANIKSSRYNAQLGETEINEGTIIYLPFKEGRANIRIDWLKPSPEILSFVDGRYVFYRSKLNQAMTGNDDPQRFNAFAFLKLSKEQLKANYAVRYIGEEQINGSVPVWHLQLTPKTTSVYKSAEMWVDASGMPVQIKVIENNGDSLTIQLSNLQKNTVVRRSEFMFNLPKGTKIIEN
ncbi:MAG TPA: VIT domain-containing protein [Pyrinomonadaceae bacterium]|nr:VIT domain-containing protein [Pyrinomonadaceae bacterium]